MTELNVSQVRKEHNEIREEDAVVKAQQGQITSESESRKQLLAKAKVEAKGAQGMMDEAKREQDEVVDKEQSAAAGIIAAMKGEIRQQLADARQEEAEHDKEAKTILGQASEMLIEAKAIVGDYTSIDRHAKKNLKKWDDPKLLSKLSFQQLKNIASKQIEEMKQQIEHAQKTGSPHHHSSTAVSREENEHDESQHESANADAVVVDAMEATKLAEKASKLRGEIEQQEKTAREARSIDNAEERTAAEAVAVARVKDLKKRLNEIEGSQNSIDLQKETGGSNSPVAVPQKASHLRHSELLRYVTEVAMLT